jgi:hypothetical protein
MNFGIMGGRRLKWLFIALLPLGLALIAWQLLHSSRPWNPLVWMTGVPRPAFDFTRAAAISEQRRVQLQSELFSSLYVWTKDRERYPDSRSNAEIDQRWQAMADEGYELAHLALGLYEPAKAYAHDPLPALRRLGELAHQGDVGAICLIARAINYQPGIVHVEVQRHYMLEHNWLQKGVLLGHPRCVGDVGQALFPEVRRAGNE